MNTDRIITDEQLKEVVTIKTQMVVAFAMARALIQVLKDPQNTGPLREIQEQTLKLLREILIQGNIVTEEEFEELNSGKRSVRMIWVRAARQIGTLN